MVEVECGCRRGVERLEMFMSEIELRLVLRMENQKGLCVGS